MTAKEPDHLILHRCYQLWDATKDFGDPEITTDWAAQTLVRMDGGPLLSAVQLGPALRTLAPHVAAARLATGADVAAARQACGFEGASSEGGAVKGCTRYVAVSIGPVGLWTRRPSRLMDLRFSDCCPRATHYPPTVLLWG